MNVEYFIERQSCPSCRSKDFRHLYSSPLDADPIKGYLESFYGPQGGVDFHYLQGAVYTLVECSACGLIFQREILSNDICVKLYEEWINPTIIRQQHRCHNDLHYFAVMAQEIMQIVSYFDTVPSKLDFLDFGMGLGQWAVLANAFGCNVSGLEITKERNDSAKINGIDVVNWEEIPSRRFDFINTEQVFEHLATPLETLVHLVGALKPNGIIKISVPTAKNIEKRLKIMDWTAHKFSKYSLNPVAPLEHINFFRRNSILRMASIAGLEETHIPMRKQYQYLTNWSGAWSIATKFLQPVRRAVVKDQNYCLFRLA